MSAFDVTGGDQVQARSRAPRGLGAPLAPKDEAAKTDEDVDAAIAGLAGLPGISEALGTTITTPPVPMQHSAQPHVLSPLARMALARARMRTVIPLDVVTFTAACPACGADCEWTQEREETQVRSYQNCRCTP
jgi:hypothetical protein